MRRLSLLSYGVPLLLFLVSCALMVQGSRDSLYSFPIDDAWIHQVYARALSLGEGFTYNTNIPEIGTTSPLWTLLTVPCHWLVAAFAWPLAPLIKGLGVVLGLLSVMLCIRILTVYMTLPQASGVGIIVALDPRFAFASLSGMEGGLLLLLFLLAVYFYQRGEEAHPAWLSHLCFGLCALTRPEALVLVPCVMAYDVYKQKRLGGHFSWLWLILPAFFWGLFCVSVNGHWLPTSTVDKVNLPTDALLTLKNLFAIVALKGVLTPIVLWLGLLALAWSAARSPREAGCGDLLWFFAALPLVFITGVSLTRAMPLVGYYWLRWVEPAVILSTVGGACGWLTLCRCEGPLAKLVVRTLGSKRAGVARAAWLAGLLLPAAASLPYFYESFADKKMHLRSDASIIRRINEETGLWLKHNTPPEAVIGVGDAGAIRYFSERKVIDLMGINHAGITFDKYGRHEVLAAVDWLVVYPIWFKDIDYEAFKQRHLVAIPYREYTVCNCPSQTDIHILQRIKPHYRDLP